MSQWIKGLRVLSLTGLLLVCLVGVITSQAGELEEADPADPINKETKSKKVEKDPPGTALYMARLRTLFDSWDLSKDNYLDKVELAKAFRGPDARPFDYKRPVREKDEEKIKEKEPDKEEKKEPTEEPSKKEDKSESKTEEKKGRTPDYSRYADYQFLVQLDVNKDEKISRTEFMNWARDYSLLLRDQAEVQKQTLQLQKQLEKNPKGKNSKSLQTQIKKQQEQIHRLEQKLKHHDAVHRRVR